MADLLFQPILGSFTLPMPTTEDVDEFTTGVQIVLPSGSVRTQVMFIGDKVKMTWAGLSLADTEALRIALASVGYARTQLTLTTGRVISVVPSGLESFKAHKRYNLASQSLRYQCEMVWREVP